MSTMRLSSIKTLLHVDKTCAYCKVDVEEVDILVEQCKSPLHFA